MLPMSCPPDRLGAIDHSCRLARLAGIAAAAGQGRGVSLQANRKTREGTSHPDRDAQFRYLAGLITECHRRRQPTISVDTKKKELVGDFKNGGREWRPQGQPLPVRVHDFLDPALGKAIPYGVYDLANNEGWVSVGITHDTAEFAVNAIRLARATTLTPPYPISRAAAAAHCRRRRSSNSGATTRYLRQRRITAGGSRTPRYDRFTPRVQELFVGLIFARALTALNDVCRRRPVSSAHWPMVHVL